MSDQGERERHERIQANWDKGGEMIDAVAFVDRAKVKATAALVVGATSFVATWLDCKELKLLASGLGIILPLAYLVFTKSKDDYFRDVAEDVGRKNTAKK